MACMDMPRKIAHVFVIAITVPTESPLACAPRSRTYLAPSAFFVLDDKFLVSAT